MTNQPELFVAMTRLPEIKPDGGRVDVAKFSDDELHRYWLTRELGGDRKPLICCGLNPSTATATKPDQTIGKDKGFARRWGCGWVGKVNAYGYRTKTPAVMHRARKSGVDIVGPDNDRWLRHAFEMAVELGGIIMVAWGNHIEPARQCEIAELLATTPGAVPMCLGTNKNGTPVHELYQPYERELVPWHCP